MADQVASNVLPLIREIQSGDVTDLRGDYKVNAGIAGGVLDNKGDPRHRPSPQVREVRVAFDLA